MLLFRENLQSEKKGNDKFAPVQVVKEYWEGGVQSSRPGSPVLVKEPPVPIE